MKFFEYTYKEGFDYYALIGAESEKDANDFYKEVCAIDDDEELSSKPREISQEEAKSKLLKCVDDENGDTEYAIQKFDTNIKETQPYLIIIDGELC